MCHNKNKTKYESKMPDYLDAENVAVSTDMTGLIQKPPADESEMESYAELGNVPESEDISERKK